MRLYIRNMVCSRCKMVVENELKKQHLHPVFVGLGEAEIEENLKEPEKTKLNNALLALGFELVDDSRSRLIEKIKQLVIKKARNEVDEKERKLKLSAFLTSHLNQEYTYLSSLFSDTEGRTIETFFITHRIEKAKELLVYGQLNLSQIAYELDYSSVAHLSSQFKKITGLTPSHFKQIGIAKRKMLEEL